jgi:hypothetical protein
MNNHWKRVLAYQGWSRALPGESFSVRETRTGDVVKISDIGDGAFMVKVLRQEQRADGLDFDGALLVADAYADVYGGWAE